MSRAAMASYQRCVAFPIEEDALAKLNGYVCLPWRSVADETTL
jgi:hypothetical protein